MTPAEHKPNTPRGRFLGMVAGSIMGLFGISRKRTTQDLKKHEFGTSTQRIGLRFTDRIRNTFRRRWIKKH